MAVNLWPLANSRLKRGSEPVVAVYGPCLGGMVSNPASAFDQNLVQVETLYIDLVNPAVLGQTTTCWPIQPGQSFHIPADFQGTATVVAASANHAFSGYVIQPAADDQPLEVLGETGKPFPPVRPTVLDAVIPAYLYQQYADDDDLQAFVQAFNEIAGWYIQWFAKTNPADYTQQHMQGVVLDWVLGGLYGIVRPALPIGIFKAVGPLNTWTLNTWPLNRFDVIPPAEYQLTTDDIFKRIVTWHLYKGDGDVFNLRWLKRRVMRFLTGANGTWGDTDETYEVSVTFGTGNEVDINFQSSRRRFVGGALLGAFGMNTTYLNEFDSEAISFPINPLAPIFKTAVDAGVLELPFQYKFVVNVQD